MKKYFEYTDEVSNKFWEINLKGKQVILTFGRIGIQNPQKIIKEFNSNKEAKKFAETKIKEKLKQYKISSNFIKITHTESVVSDEETPLAAVKNSKNTSMWNCIKSQIIGDSDISLSAGNTGVLLVVSHKN